MEDKEKENNEMQGIWKKISIFLLMMLLVSVSGCGVTSKEKQEEIAAEKKEKWCAPRQVDN